MSENEEKNKKKFDLFISYYSGTGSVLAKYLKKNIKDFNYTAFLDKEDIDTKIKEETDEWRSEIDHALENSDNFVLIMTWGFKDRAEIKREYKKALSNGLDVFLFKQAELDNKDLLMKMDNKIIDFSKKHYTAFTDECDLLAKVGRTLSGQLKPRLHSIFRHEAEKLIVNEGKYFKRANIPLVEVVIGSTIDNEEWLPINPLNKHLLHCFPYCNEVEARRSFFECKRDGEVFYKVKTNGTSYALLKLDSDDNDPNLVYFDSIFYHIAQVLLFSVRIMKFHNIKSEQSIIILLRNVGAKKVAFSIRNKWRWQYSFTDSAPQIEFNYNFSPNEEYNQIGKLLLKVYKDLCSEAGCLDIKDETVEYRVTEILKRMSELRTEYKNAHATLPRLDLASFSFS